MAEAETNGFDLFTQMIKEETDESAAIITFQTLHKILSNIKQNPTVEKYRTIRKENPAFSKKVWCFEGAQQLLLALGFVDVGDCIVLVDDSQIPAGLLELDTALRQHNETTSNGVSAIPGRELTEKEQKLQEERKRQLQKLRREKEERQRINEQIKADRKDVGTREVKDSQAQQLKFGANMKSFKDIGVDLNRGGG